MNKRILQLSGLNEASFMQDVAQDTTAAKSAPSVSDPEGAAKQQGQQTTADIIEILKTKGIDVSNPIVAQVANKLNPQEANLLFTQLTTAVSDIKQLPEVLTSLLSLSTQIKNFNQLPIILNTLSKADTMTQS